MVNHCIANFFRSDIKKVLFSHCPTCGTTQSQKLSSYTIINQDTFITDVTYYDSANVHFFNCSFRQTPRLSDSLRYLSWTTCNALLSDFPELPNGLEYLHVENNFTLTECPKLPKSIKYLYLMHTAIPVSISPRSNIAQTFRIKY
jgi:hypothetical protein